MKYFALIASVLVCFVPVESICPAGWHSNQGHCYLFSKLAETWPTASVYCRALGSNLVTIDDAVEHSWLKSELNKVHASQVASNTLVSYWTSGNDIAYENTWVWANNQPFDYTSWGVGEPNNGRGANCVGLHSIEGFNFNDNYCDTARTNYICESEEFDGPIIG